MSHSVFDHFNAYMFISKELISIRSFLHFLLLKTAINKQITISDARKPKDFT